MKRTLIAFAAGVLFGVLMVPGMGRMTLREWLAAGFMVALMVGAYWMDRTRGEFD